MQVQVEVEVQKRRLVFITPASVPGNVKNKKTKPVFLDLNLNLDLYMQ